MAIILTNENYDQIVNSSVPAVIDFCAEWCGPCRAIAPAVDALAAEYEGRVNVCKCNVDNYDAISSKYGVRSIPTLVFIKNGQTVDRHVGLASKSDLEEKIKKLL